MNVCVGGIIGPDPMPLGEFFRFARVISATLVALSDAHYMCARCNGEARYRLTVEWEAGYESPDGNALCEHCVDGVVTAGAEAILLGAQPPSKGAYAMSVTYGCAGASRDPFHPDLEELRQHPGTQPRNVGVLVVARLESPAPRFEIDESLRPAVPVRGLDALLGRGNEPLALPARVVVGYGHRIPQRSSATTRPLAAAM